MYNMSSHQRVVEAVNHLITSPNYASLINEMTKIVETWDTHPMVYGGKLNCLNSMIDVGLANRDAFEKLLSLIEQKRSLLPKVRRVDYQRDLMRDRRARLNKAVQLYELTSGHVLKGAERTRYTSELQQRWKVARDEEIAAKGDLTWKERNDAANTFWEGLDMRLDKNLADARRKRA